MCLKPFENERYTRAAFEPIILALRKHDRRWFFPGKAQITKKYTIAEMQSMTIRQLKQLAEEHDIDVTDFLEKEEYIDALQLQLIRSPRTTTP